MDSPANIDIARRARMAMGITIVSFSVFFITALVSYAVVWNISKDTWRLGDGGGLPWPVYVSTAILLAGSGVAARMSTYLLAAPHKRVVARFLALLTLLGIVFLAAQSGAWVLLVSRDLPLGAKDMVSFTFYMLTGLHALHVIVGVLGTFALWILLSRKGESMYSYVRPCAWYWHFMDVGWLVFLAVMAVTM